MASACKRSIVVATEPSSIQTSDLSVSTATTIPKDASCKNCAPEGLHFERLSKGKNFRYTYLGMSNVEN